MAKKGLKIVLPSAVTNAEGLRKLEHYYGIEFTRGASNGGGENGYHAMIGDESLLKELRFHNQMKIAAVKDAEVVSYLNQTNWRQLEGGGASVLDGTDGSDIMQVHTKTIYAILGGTHPTYERFIISDQPFSYDGDEAKEYPAFGEAPDYATLLNGVMRSIRNDSVAGTHNAGYGKDHSSPLYGTAEAGGYPRTVLSRFQYEQYARAKNADVNSNLPYANICNQDLELAAAFMFIEFRTKQLNNILGHGLSANAAPTEATWGKVSGFRLTDDNGQTYRYHTLGTSMYVGEGAATAVNMWNILNGSCPLLKMFEAQLAVSDGNSLEAVNDADGNPVAGLAQGVMTGIYTKSFTFNLEAALTSGGDKKTWKVECVLRVPMWRGRTRLWGNCAQWYSGYEFLLWKEGQTAHYKLFRSPSVEKLMTDSDSVTKDAAGKFAFESAYEEVGEMPTNNSTAFGIWALNMQTKDGISCAVAKDSGGSMASGESAHFYTDHSALSEGQFVRRGAPFGGLAGEGACVLRYAAGNSPAYAGSSFGSSFRVTLND